MKLIKTLNFFCIFFAAIFSFVLLKCSSSNLQDEMNIPKAVIENSNQLIISKTGKDFFYKNFSIDPEKSQAVKNNYLITYKFKIQGKSFVDEEISFMVDSTGKVLNEKKITGISNCVNQNCIFSIDEENAKKIAEDSKLEKGIKDWKAEFIWNEKFEKYVWQIISTLSESQGSEGYRGSGKEMLIDPADGTVLETKVWHVR